MTAPLLFTIHTERDNIIKNKKKSANAKCDRRFYYLNRSGFKSDNPTTIKTKKRLSLVRFGNLGHIYQNNFFHPNLNELVDVFNRNVNSFTT